MAKNTTPENTIPETAEREYIVNYPAGVHFRETPGGKSLFVLPDKIGVYGQDYPVMPDWMEVRTGERTGWVKSEYLRAAGGGDA